jgi:ssDNA-binding replication factor A large subunit
MDSPSPQGICQSVGAAVELVKGEDATLVDYTGSISVADGGDPDSSAVWSVSFQNLAHGQQSVG